VIPVRETVAQAADDQLFAGLADDGDAAVTRLDRARQQEVADAQRPAIVTVLGDESPADVQPSGSSPRTTEWRVWGFVTAASGESIETAVNRMAARIERAVLADTTIGGVADDVIYDGFEHDIEAQMGRRTADLVMTFRLIYSTAPDDPFAPLN